MGQEITREKTYITERYGKQNITFESLSASYLRMETLLSTSQTIDFNINNNTNQIVSENRLNQTDQFIVTHIGFALKKIAAAAPTNAQHTIAKLYTWPNSNTGLFDGAAGDANLPGIYNGFFQISLNRKIYVPAIDMRSFYRVPDAQEGQPLAAIAGPVTYALKADGFSNGLYGFFPVDYIRLNGYDLLEPQIQLPSSIAMTEANESNYAVLLMKGYLASGMGLQRQSNS